MWTIREGAGRTFDEADPRPRSAGEGGPPGPRRTWGSSSAPSPNFPVSSDVSRETVTGRSGTMVPDFPLSKPTRLEPGPIDRLRQLRPVCPVRPRSARPLVGPVGPTPSEPRRHTQGNSHRANLPPGDRAHRARHASTPLVPAQPRRLVTPPSRSRSTSLARAALDGFALKIPDLPPRDPAHKPPTPLNEPIEARTVPEPTQPRRLVTP